MSSDEKQKKKESDKRKRPASSSSPSTFSEQEQMKKKTKKTKKTADCPCEFDVLSSFLKTTYKEMEVGVIDNILSYVHRTPARFHRACCECEEVVMYSFSDGANLMCMCEQFESGMICYECFKKTRIAPYPDRLQRAEEKGSELMYGRPAYMYDYHCDLCQTCCPICSPVTNHWSECSGPSWSCASCAESNHDYEAGVMEMLANAEEDGYYG
jgi:hypothetical protein